MTSLSAHVSPVTASTAASAAVHTHSKTEGFSPYKVRVFTSLFSYSLWNITSSEAEETFLQELYTQVYQHHKLVKIESEKDDWISPRLEKALGKFCELEKTHVGYVPYESPGFSSEENKGDVTFESCGAIVVLHPSVQKKELNENNETVVAYENGVVEIISSEQETRSTRKGERRFPDGSKEVGDFHFSETTKLFDALETGVRLFKGKEPVYVYPYFIEERFNPIRSFGFAKDQQLVPFQQKGASGEYIIPTGSLVDHLVLAAQEKNSEIVKALFDLKTCPIDPRDFLSALQKLSKNPMDWNLTPTNLFHTIELAVKHKIQL